MHAQTTKKQTKPLVLVLPGFHRSTAIGAEGVLAVIPVHPLLLVAAGAAVTAGHCSQARDTRLPRLLAALNGALPARKAVDAGLRAAQAGGARGGVRAD
jgi:hypothetical protein